MVERQSRKEFSKYLLGMKHQCPTELIDLYQRALIVERFPAAYTFTDVLALSTEEIAQIFHAIDLLNLAEQIRKQG